MRHLLSLIAATLLVGLSMMASATTASAQGVQLFASLFGGNEIDAAGKARAGDLDGYGAANVIFAKVGSQSGQLCFGLTVHGIDKPTAAHIHRGTAGVNGGVVVTLIPPIPPANGSPGTSSGCVNNVPTGLLNLIRATPSAFYVNVHTTKFPNGALRGQLF